jgi:hypothetical protein
MDIRRGGIGGDGKTKRKVENENTTYEGISYPQAISGTTNRSGQG